MNFVFIGAGKEGRHCALNCFNNDNNFKFKLELHKLYTNIYSTAHNDIMKRRVEITVIRNHTKL